jgi:CBS domain-containing protein
MAKHGISAVPVVDKNQRVIGMVSEAISCTAPKSGPSTGGLGGSKWRRRPNKLAGDYIKSHSGKVKDVMTRDVISVVDTTPVADIAVVLETNRIKRVPVLRDGKLVGIVSRANLERALAMTITEPGSGAEADDRAIRDKLLAELKAQKWAEVSPANITVKDGVVHLWSSYLSERERQALIVAAENTPSVRGVEDHMRPVPAYLLG